VSSRVNSYINNSPYFENTYALIDQAFYNLNNSEIVPYYPRPSAPYGELKALGEKDAHHIIQDAAARDLPNYERGLAPAVKLKGPSTNVGSEHYRATQVQLEKGGGTYAAERFIAYKSLRRAGIPDVEARALIDIADSFFRSIGVTKETITRIPKNRSKN
jgi:hypothetical protein